MNVTAYAESMRTHRKVTTRMDTAGSRAPYLAPVGSFHSTLHAEIVPAEVRSGDPIAARVGLSGARDWAEAQVWRISPLGVELVRPLALAGASTGTAIDLTLRLGEDVARFTGLSISATWVERGRELVGARWSPRVESRSDGTCRRDGARWRCDDDFAPTGIAKNALRFGDFVHFRVAEI